MRLDRLEVTGFGALRDRTIEFHAGLTVVLGDNESGKSTLHRAVRAALYGMDAGGQGRPVDRSDWARWQPWDGGAYAIALTYTLEDGRRIRVARRLDSREQPVQVLELGGSELTEELRRGRSVCPGQFHLGIDESVFCATAWLGDEALRLSAGDAPAARAERLQEAIERLADTRNGATATEALTRLGEAMQRIGTERRAGSPLGAATTRLRELDRQLEEARRRTTTLAGLEEHLRDLERQSHAALEEAEAAEVAWLRGRITSLEERRRQRVDAEATLQQLAAVGEECRPFAAFPLDVEERALALGGALAQAELNASEAEARRQATVAPLEALRRRRTEIEHGLAAFGAAAVEEEALQQAQRLRGELAATRAGLAGVEGNASAEARATALRREIAHTGLGALPLGSAQALADLMSAARARRAPLRLAALTFAVVAAAVGVGVWAGMHHLTAVLGACTALAAVVAVAGSAVTVSVARRTRFEGAQLRELERAAGLEAGDVRTAEDRVARLRALHAALVREEAEAAGRRALDDRVHAAARSLTERCAQLAEATGVMVGTVRPASTARALLDDADEMLTRLDEAATAQRRRTELEAEDRMLAEREAEFLRLQDEAEHCRETVDHLRDRLGQLLAGAGLPLDASSADALATVRHACASRRSFEEATRGMQAVHQRLALLGDDSALADALQRLRDEVDRYGEVAELADAALLDEAALQQLEVIARHARQTLVARSAEAREVRARLGALLEHAPDLADLENERDACAATRARALRQLAALRTASELIQQSSRLTHRDMAPQLAARVTAALRVLTDSRYSAVNVDTDHFAVALLGPQRPDLVPLELASHGTRDQVALLLRIALCEVLSGSGERIPVLLDEPVLSADPARREILLEFLMKLSTTHQVLLTTSDPAVAAATQACSDGECTVIRLDESAVPSERQAVISVL